MNRRVVAALALVGCKVENGFHAVSLDELRVNFPPTLWNARQGIVQEVFPGAHADVGGGYPSVESQLSDVSLLWMKDRLAGVGARFGPQPNGIHPDPLGKSHEPWNEGFFAKLPRKPRQWPNPHGLIANQAVMDRMAAGTYSPANWP